MSDGSHKPVFVPPTLGESLEHHGMRYDFSSVEEKKNNAQKYNRNRHKENRRDSTNRPTGEITMETIKHTNGTVEAAKNNGNNIPQLHEGLVALVDAIKDGNDRVNETLQQFGTSANTLNESMRAVVTDVAVARAAAENAMTAASAAERAVKKQNEIRSWDNLKGDARSAVVHIGVASVFAGVVYLANSLFRSDVDVSANPAPLPGGAVKAKIQA